MEKATINFITRDQANEFARLWSRKTLTGHVINKSSVTVYDVDKSKKEFIDNYISKLNKT